MSTPEETPATPANPYTSSSTTDGSVDPKGGPSSNLQAYNVVSDTVVGVNFRKSDNYFQAKVIGVCIPIGAIIGSIVSWSQSTSGEILGGALVGGIGGIIVGTFGSGIYLMVYRMINHLRGKHD